MKSFNHVITRAQALAMIAAGTVQPGVEYYISDRRSFKTIGITTNQFARDGQMLILAGQFSNVNDEWLEIEYDIGLDFFYEWRDVRGNMYRQRRPFKFFIFFFLDNILTGVDYGNTSITDNEWLSPFISIMGITGGGSVTHNIVRGTLTISGDASVDYNIISANGTINTTNINAAPTVYDNNVRGTVNATDGYVQSNNILDGAGVSTDNQGNVSQNIVMGNSTIFADQGGVIVINQFSNSAVVCDGSGGSAIIANNIVNDTTLNALAGDSAVTVYDNIINVSIITASAGGDMVENEINTSHVSVSGGLISKNTIYGNSHVTYSGSSFILESIIGGSTINMLGSSDIYECQITNQVTLSMSENSSLTYSVLDVRNTYTFVQGVNIEHCTLNAFISTPVVISGLDFSNITGTMIPGYSNIVGNYIIGVGITNIDLVTPAANLSTRELFGRLQINCSSGSETIITIQRNDNNHNIRLEPDITSTLIVSPTAVATATVDTIVMPTGAVTYLGAEAEKFEFYSHSFNSVMRHFQYQSLQYA